jgi:putative tricarboxylic transport membrane protein
VLESIGFGLWVAMQPANLTACFVGVFVGTLIGVLPGVGPVATMSLLLPATFAMSPTAAIIMMAGIYYGAMYGGSITSILVNIPGEAASIVTCLDGHVMAKNGRAGPALGIAAFGSLFAGMAATAGMVLIGPLLARASLSFGPPETLALIVLGLTLVTFISSGSKLRSVMSSLCGLLLSAVGLDAVSGQERFVHDIPYFFDGISVIILAMGVFGIGEILTDAEERSGAVKVLARPVGRELLPSREDWRRSAGPIGRGTVLGFVLGLLPGGGAMVASFASYVMEKRLSSRPQMFGRGAIEGVAGPEAANNAGAQANFVPLLNLGIPGNATMGVFLGALLIQGVTPGPMLIVEHPELYWGVIVSMAIGNVMLIVLNVPLIGLFVRLLSVPASVLSPLILMICIVGAFSLNNSVADVLVMFAAGLGGYLMRKAKLDAAPFIISFVLGSMLETSLHQTIAIGYGSILVLFERPISATILAATVLLVAASLIGSVWLRRQAPG